MVEVLKVCLYEFIMEMGPLKLENQVKKFLSYVMSPHLPRLREGALHFNISNEIPTNGP